MPPPDTPASPAESEVETLRRRLAELEASNRGLGQALDQTREDAARLKVILDSATDYAIITLDAAGRITGWNVGAQNVLGWREAEVLGRESALIFVPEDRAREAPEAELVKATAEGRAMDERWHVRRDGSRFWGSGLMVPLRDGRGFLKVLRDRTDHRAAEERQRLLLAELSHRVKNILALVLSIARRTGRRAATIQAYQEALEGRVAALAAAHDLLTASGWREVGLVALARRVLAPHAEAGRLRLEVGDAALGAPLAQTLVLVLHELATNAIKHGALSVPEGRVALRGGPEDSELRLFWEESGGPPPREPRETGFGMAMLTRAIGHQHGGRVELDWRPQGLACRLTVPLEGDRAAGP